MSCRCFSVTQFIYTMKHFTLKEKGKWGLFEFQESVKDAIPPDLPNPPHRIRRTAGHALSKITLKVRNTNRISRKKCRICKKSTTFQCLGCPEQPGVCAVRCFDLYHSD